MTLTTRVIGGLVLGLAAGMAINASQVPMLLTVGSWIEPAGTLWVHGILMTVIPLVVSNLILGVASADDTRRIGQLGRRALLLFLAMVLVSSSITALVAPSLFAWLPFDAAAADSFRASATAVASQAVSVPATFREWLVGLVPSNPVKAAADGAMLPIVVFTLAFALAVAHLPMELRSGLLRVVEAIAAAMRILIEWVLALAPIGIFALALGLAAHLGMGAAGALGYYVVVVCILPVGFLLLMYPVAAIGGRVPMRRFASAAAPAQAVAFSTRSSLASLPALIESAEQRLGLPPAVVSFSLPLAVSIFKFCGPVVVMVGALFVGRLYGIPIDSVRLVEATGLTALLSFTVPGIPGGGLIATAPANVTADLAVATILARHGYE